MQLGHCPTEVGVDLLAYAFQSCRPINGIMIRKDKISRP